MGLFQGFAAPAGISRDQYEQYRINEMNIMAHMMGQNAYATLPPPTPVTNPLLLLEETL